MPDGFAFPPFWLATPNTPDLGCFVSRQHGFERDYDFHAWPEYSPIANDAHQAYMRIQCGEAAFFQRAGVSMRHPSVDLFTVVNTPPDEVLGGDFRPRPSDWIKFSPQRNPKLYWLMGEHRNPSSSTWTWDEAVGHSYDIYQNGTLSTVGWDDTGGDRDYDDLIVEIAVVRRDSYFAAFEVATADEARARKFERLSEEFPDKHRERHSLEVAEASAD